MRGISKKSYENQIPQKNSLNYMRRFFRIGLSVFFLLVFSDQSEATSKRVERCNAHEAVWLQHHGREIFHKFGGDDVHAFFGFTPYIKVFHSEKPYAAAHGMGEIHVSSSMIGLVQSVDELAFVLAHELSHYLLMHHIDYGEGSLRAHERFELEADAMALILMREGGFKSEAALSFLARLTGHKLTNTDIALGELYPTLRVRSGALTSS